MTHHTYPLRDPATGRTYHPHCHHRTAARILSRLFGLTYASEVS